jgi:RNA polymerase sigma-70 factor, ECF subfamily
VALKPDPTDEIERVYRARYAAFLRVAVGILRDEQLAEEAVHDAFVRALRYRKRFDGRGSLEGWIWRIVVNEARRRRPAREILLDAAPVSTELADEPDDLEALVAALPMQQRMALFLRYYADLDYQTIAGVLGVKTGTVAAALHAAHTTLRRQLAAVRR